ncbi:hypothetical protein [Deefgea sp. CFH1-16]|uniref:hypothetical protein n=1 Tax=Deefgea sp. CFH1-16 TaxID=2675457 RepID=UPI0015F4F6F6|nr:hypothetical protein [Deefgea sp. CFH1-16]MBM5573185.1 hypothetical protein [Deefgea sp. CFH1-16]
MTRYDFLENYIPKLSVTGSIPVGRTNQINDLAQNKLKNHGTKPVYRLLQTSSFIFFYRHTKKRQLSKIHGNNLRFATFFSRSPAKTIKT